MFAVFETGGKQYRVSPDDIIRVERLSEDAGTALELSEVLAIGDGDTLTLGKPRIDGARVAATIIDHVRADKIIVFRKNRRKNYRRKRGHRQHLTVLRIDEILAAGQKRSKVAEPAKADEPAAKKPKSEAAAKKPAAETKTAAAKKPAAKSDAAKKSKAADSAAAPKASAAKSEAKETKAKKDSDAGKEKA